MMPTCSTAISNIEEHSKSMGTMMGRLLVLLAILLGSGGCQTAAYYSQAVVGQARMLCGRQSIKKMVADPTQPRALADKLKLVLELREYAHTELGLDPGDNYLKYKALDRKFALWVVYAAPEFNVYLKSWWYPVVGRFTSRGWFTEGRARRYADQLRQRGLDVHVGGAPAYSTLGWFADPVLSTFVLNSDADLAELIFHELTHKRLFLPGDTSFNESFATATAQAGVLRWLKDQGDDEAVASYHAECLREATFARLAFEARDSLKKLYATSQPDDTKRKRKSAILDGLKKQLLDLHQNDPEYSGVARWAERPINNATLSAIAVYHRQVPAFERLLEECDGDLEKFFAEVVALSKLAKDERAKRMEKLTHEN
jgi:predicted aminopeptidase